MFHVKCHFAYNPRNDPLLPCHEAGLAFGRNDILHVFDRTDTWWWQVSYGDRFCSSQINNLVSHATFEWCFLPSIDHNALQVYINKKVYRLLVWFIIHPNSF